LFPLVFCKTKSSMQNKCMGLYENLANCGTKELARTSALKALETCRLPKRNVANERLGLTCVLNFPKQMLTAMSID